MNITPTLRERVSQISIGTFIITIAIMLTSFILYSMKKAQIEEEHVIHELSANLPAQINQFLPSFLLPEQKQGIDLILERLKRNEGLSEARIFTDLRELESSFSGCKLSPEQVTSCTSRDQHFTAVIAPLSESGQHFGYLYKSKRNVSPGSMKDVLQVAGLIIFSLGLVFAGVYIFISRLLSRTLPASLDNLVRWIEADVNGQKIEHTNLPFKELEDLKTKISEVLERYNNSREQAIIGQLTRGIMHDIKTPLQSMVAAMHLVEEQEKDSPKRVSRLENAHLMSQLNLPLICNIIETTLDGNRAIKIHKKAEDISATVQKSVSLSLAMAKLRNVTLEQNIDENARALHDDVQFTRVVQNLVKNAIESAAENPEQKLVRISTKNSDRGVVLSIEDTGAGFNIAHEKIFKAFRTTKVRGTGLGLIISKKIVDAHGGSISAFSSMDLRGAKLEVLIPKSEEVGI